MELQDSFVFPLKQQMSIHPKSSNSDSERQIFKKLFMTILFALRVFARFFCWGIDAEKFFFIILFWCLTWNFNCGIVDNTPIHYLLDYGDYNSILL